MVGPCIDRLSRLRDVYRYLTIREKTGPIGLATLDALRQEANALVHAIQEEVNACRPDAD